MRPDTPTFCLGLSFPAIMGVVNVTPDSFSDGGRFLAADVALEQALTLAREGASVIDIGGESTRPGSETVPLDTELQRVLPVVEALAARVGVPISVDTMKAEVARRTLAAGATMVNDVSALRFDEEMVDVVAESGCPVCLMHMKGQPKTMQDDPRYDDVVAEVTGFLVERVAAARAAGVPEVWIDPGIGFGKTIDHNLALLAHLDRLVATGLPVLVGTSRKRFLGDLLARADGQIGAADGPGPVPVDDRLEGSLATVVWAARAGVTMVRVHDVAATVAALGRVDADDPRSPAAPG